MGDETVAIRALNDAFRQSFLGGGVNMTAGIAALQVEVRDAIFQRVRTFTAFDEGNDPHGEHDFGSFMAHDRKVFWKIDYYTKDMSAGSEHPENPAKTLRVLTIMLAEEY